MKIHELFKRPSSPKQTQWDSLKDVQFNKNNPENNPNNPNESRQQRKIVNILLTRNLDILNQSDIEMTERQQSQVFEMINNGTVTQKDFERIVDNIQGPGDQKSSASILNSLGGEKHESRILTTASGRGFERYYEAGADDIDKFLGLYPNPANFESFEKPFLEDIRVHNPPEKYKEYLEAMHSFKQKLYGKKQEYWDSSKALIEEAKTKKQHEREDIARTPNSLNSKAILKRTKIDGDPMTINNKEYQLTPDLFKQFGLEPRHEIKIENVSIALSKAFKVGNRDAAIGYVIMPNGEIKARSYYRSNSAGLWRYLPDYTVDKTGAIDHYGKGYDEESCTLPFELQKELNSISENDRLEINAASSRLAFFGTAKKCTPSNPDPSYRGDYYREVRQRPSIQMGVPYPKKRPPEFIDIIGYDTPNFHKELSASKTKTNLYGEQTMRLFESYDQRIKYLMCDTRSRSGELQTWVGGMELSSPITSTGCRSEWISMGDIGTPLYEYNTQTGGYGDQTDTKYDYENMWSRYLKRTPLIKRYLNIIHNIK